MIDSEDPSDQIFDLNRLVYCPEFYPTEKEIEEYNQKKITTQSRVEEPLTNVTNSMNDSLDVFDV